MKKILLLVLICISTNVFAQNSNVFAPKKVKVVAGDFGFLKPGQTLDVEFTYVSLRVGNTTEDEYVAKNESRGNADAWREKWISSRKERFEPKFIENFNKQLEAQNISITSKGDYKMLVNVYLMETDDANNRYSVSLSVRFFNKTSNAEEMRLYITGASPAKSASDFTTGIAESYGKAGKMLADFIVKNKKSNITVLYF
jgi:hypothetical protein